jgi:hypothetical protein
MRTAVPRGTETTIEAVAISKQKCIGDTFRSILKNESKCWTEFYNVKRRKGNRENIPVIKDGNGWLITD